MSKGYWKNSIYEQFDNEGDDCPVCTTGTLEVYIEAETTQSQHEGFKTIEGSSWLRCNTCNKFLGCNRSQSAWNRKLEENFYNEQQ